MFFDGIFYAAVSNNYAHHIGTFWAMQYSPAFPQGFHDQPPLAIFLQAICFRLFGDSIFIERFYCFGFALLNIYMIKNIWDLVVQENLAQFWLPILIWIIIPLTAWTFQNNLMEVTMSAFDVLAIYFVIKGSKNHSLLYLLLGGLFTFLAGFTKGFQGLFPVAAPFLYWIIYRHTDFKNWILQLSAVLLIPIVCIAFLYFYPDSHLSLQLYIEHRLSGTFHHIGDTTTSHFFLLYKLVLYLLIPVSLIFIAWFLTRNNTSENVMDRKSIYFFMLIGLSASLPLIVTLEQRVFYLTTSLPFFAIALALIALPTVEHVIMMLSNINRKVINNVLITLILILIILIPIHSSKPKREADLIADLSIIHKSIPENTALSIPAELNDHWAYHAYFMRYCRISLDDKHRQKYFLSENKMKAPADSCYQLLNLPLKKFKLYECKSK